MSETKPRGFDASHWNGEINYQLMAQDPYNPDFAIFKMGEGFYIWPRYYQQFNGAASISLLRSSYYFWRNRYKGKDQMTFFHDGALKGEWNNVIDIEDLQVPSNLPNADRLALLANIDQTVDWYNALFGKLPLIYTGGWWWTPRIGSGASFLKEVDIFIAYYYGLSIYKPDSCEPMGIPKPWSDRAGKKYLIHQYSERGHVAGVNSQLDLDTWNGTHDEMLTYMGQTNWVKKPYEPKPFSGYVDVPWRNIRSGPGTTFPIIDHKVRKDVVTFTKYQNGWAQLENGNWMMASSGIVWTA